MPRLFVAIDLPDSIKDALEGLGAARLAGARPVRRDQMHLTLRFIGETPREAMARLQNSLATVTLEPFSLALQGVGQFPPRGALRVLWVGVAASPTLAQWHQQIESALNTLGYPPEQKPFSPHITLARFKTPPPRDALRQFMTDHVSFATPSFGVRYFTLYESILTSRGPHYRVVERWGR